MIIKCSEREEEIVDAPLRSRTLPDTATQMWLFVNDCPPTTGFSTEEQLISICKRYCKSLSQAIVAFFIIHFLNYPLTIFWPAI